MKTRDVVEVWRQLEGMGAGAMRDPGTGTLDAIGALIVSVGCPPDEIKPQKVNPRFVYLVMERYEIDLDQLVTIVTVNDMLQRHSGIYRRDYMIDWTTARYPDHTPTLT